VTGTYFYLVNKRLKYSSSVRIHTTRVQKILSYFAEVERTLLAASNVLLRGYREAYLSLTMRSDV